MKSFIRENSFLVIGLIGLTAWAVDPRLETWADWSLLITGAISSIVGIFRLAASILGSRSHS